MPATIVKSSFSWESADEWQTASACTEGSSTAVEQPSARNRWVNSTISSRVGVGLCSHIFSFNVVGRPFENCLVNNAVLASFERDGSAFDKMFSSSHLYTEGSSSDLNFRCSNSAKKFSRFACGHRARRIDFTASLYVRLSPSGIAYKLQAARPRRKAGNLSIIHLLIETQPR